MKSLNDIKEDMSQLYEDVKSGRTELKQAAELSNIAGKYLKAEQLALARDIFLRGFPSPLNPGTNVGAVPTYPSNPQLVAPAARSRKRDRKGHGHNS